MCSSDIFLGVLAIFFPPVAGNAPMRRSVVFRVTLLSSSPRPLLDRTRLIRKPPQYGSKKDYAPPTLSLTLPSVAWGISPDSSMPGT